MGILTIGCSFFMKRGLWKTCELRHGSVCVVTGASRGLGRGIALELAAAGGILAKSVQFSMVWQRAHLVSKLSQAQSLSC